MAVKKWSFKPGDRDGFTASPMTIFQGARLQATVRETIQNSLDAGRTSPVEVCFSLVTKNMKDLPEIADLRNAMSLAASEQEAFEGGGLEQKSEASSFYDHALKVILSAEKISIFGIHDFNTSGLTGALREQQGVKPGPWLALVKGAGVDVKDDPASLGSFGQGSKAPFALSQLRSLFYYSQVFAADTEQLEGRFQGKSILSSFWQSDESGEPQLRIGTGFFGVGEGQDALTGSDIPSWAIDERSKFGNAPGTSILLPAPLGHDTENPEAFWRMLKISVITNFYYALAFRKLVVRLQDGSVLNHESCKSVALQLGLLDDEMSEALDPETIDKVEALKTVVFADHSGIKQSRSFGDFYWAIRVGEKAPGRKVGIARKTGMLITRRPPEFIKFKGMGNFDIFVCVTADEGSKVLRALENPSHDAFEYDRISDPVKLAATKKSYGAFAAEVKEIIREYAALTGDKEETTSDLNDLLGGALDESQDKTLRTEFPGKSKVREGLKPLRKTAAEDGDDEGTSGAGGGDGAGGGNSRGGAGTGRGTGDGTSGSVSKLVEGLLFVPQGKDHFRIFFSTKPALSSRLVVYASGDSARKLLPLKVGSSTVSEVPVSDWVKVDKGKNRYSVDVEIPNFSGAIEAEVRS